MRAELQLGLEIGAPRRMVPFLSAKSRIAWYNFLMIRFLNARNRLYLGCPATSATVERLFSAVGHAYDDKRQSANAGTLQSLMFSKANVPSRPDGK